MHKYIHTYIYTSIHTYIHPYIYTYIHTHIHKYIYASSRDENSRDNTGNVQLPKLTTNAMMFL